MLYDSDQEYCVNSPTKYDKNEQENRKSRKSSDRKWEGKEEGREGGAICIFLESPALMNGAAIAFRFAVQWREEWSRASSYCQLIAIFFCALPLSPFARSKTDLASFRASCTFFSGSKRHRRKDHHVVAGFRVGHADGISCVPFSLCFALPHVRLVIYLVVMGLG